MIVECNELKYKLAMLEKEWDHVETHISRFDTIIFAIRGWAISVLTAVLVVAATQRLPVIMVVSIAPMAYLSSDSFTRDLQSGKLTGIATPRIASMFGQGTVLERLRELISAAKLRNVAVTYVSLIALCLLSYVALASFSQQ
jgi:hypothetical protein